MSWRRWSAAAALAAVVTGAVTLALTRPGPAPGHLLVLASVAVPSPQPGASTTAQVDGLMVRGNATGGGWRQLSSAPTTVTLPGSAVAPNTAELLQEPLASGSYSQERLVVTADGRRIVVDRSAAFQITSGQTTPLLFTFRFEAGNATPEPLSAYGGNSQVTFGLALASRQIRSVPDTSFIDQAGKPVRLSQYRGKVVVLASFLTECQETCPLVAAALLQLHSMLNSHGLGSQVQILEATQDPEDDTPAILTKYQRYFSLPWPLLTGAPAAINSFWSSLGVPPVQALPWGGPAPIDLFTGRPEPYNLIHASVLEVINPEGYIVTVMQSQPTLSPSTVPKTIYHYLDAQGRSELKTGGSWTPQTVYQAIAPLLQQEREVNAFPKTSQAVPGKLAPNFTLTSTSGARVTLAKLKGRPVMLDFWASWCTNCKADMGLVARAAKLYSARGLSVVLIDDQQSSRTAENFLRSLQVHLPSLLDTRGTVAEAYGLPGLPVAVFIKPSGVISSLILGQLQSGELRSAIGKILTG